jgi:hypothetical protein
MSCCCKRKWSLINVIYRVLLGPFVLDFGVACLVSTMGERGSCRPIVQFDRERVPRNATYVGAHADTNDTIKNN